MKKGLLILVLSGALLSPLFIPISSAATHPFGGKVVKVIYCTCSSNYWVIYSRVKADMPLSLSYRTLTSKLYEFGQIFTPGVHILGNSSVDDDCVMHMGSSCVNLTSFNSPKLITIVGTSDFGNLAGSGSGPRPLDKNRSGQVTKPEVVKPGESTRNQEATGDTTPCTSSTDKLASSYVMSNEGWTNRCYDDVGSDGVTRQAIGYGHNIDGTEGIDCSQVVPEAKINHLFDRDYRLARYRAKTAANNHGVKWNSLSPERQSALTDMSYQMGQGGVNGFDQMWSNVKLAQDTGNQEYWDKAGDEVVDSQGYGKVPSIAPRANRNASVMRTGKQDLLNEKINDSARAKANCTDGTIA